LALSVECQPQADARFNWVPYLAEQFNPTFKHHRARFRPFASQLGSPIINVRGSRSIENDTQVTQPAAKCMYAFESLFCTGTTSNGQVVKVECDAQENFNRVNLKATTKMFALSDLRILKTGENNGEIVKMYMMAKNETTQRYASYIARDKATEERLVMSVHTVDQPQDQGITILNPKCWTKMVQMFKELKPTTAITLEKEEWDSDLKELGMWDKPIKTIAHMSFL